MRHLLRAIQIDPENADARNNLGMVLREFGRTREAIVDGASTSLREFRARDIVLGTRHELGLSWILPRIVGLTHANDILLSGTLQNDSGSVHFDGQKLDGLAAHERTHRGLARSFQLPRPFHSLTVAQNLRVPLLYTVGIRRDGAMRNLLVGCHMTHAP